TFVLLSHKVVSEGEGENDVLVSVRSSTWGTHLGTWRADHFHTINKRYVLEFRNRTGNIAPYYVRAVGEVLTRIDGEVGG
ncbi:MAG: hypothetical protein JWN40_320, partial [Phycisphaerales bacterium]|nr:hypothetical protein [Phycisphaerales bacterium]